MRNNKKAKVDTTHEHFMSQAFFYPGGFIPNAHSGMIIFNKLASTERSSQAERSTRNLVVLTGRSTHLGTKILPENEGLNAIVFNIRKCQTAIDANRTPNKESATVISVNARIVRTQAQSNALLKNHIVLIVYSGLLSLHLGGYAYGWAKKSVVRLSESPTTLTQSIWR